jgi:hypothetical protein
VWWRVARSDSTAIPHGQFELMIRASPAALEMIAPEVDERDASEQARRTE